MKFYMLENYGMNIQYRSVRNPDMSGSGAGHVRPTSLEPGLRIGYVRSGTQSLRNLVRLNMSALGAGHVREVPLKSGLEAEYAWLTWEKAKRQDMFGLGAEHVRLESLESS
jgi:hypothetical protein